MVSRREPQPPPGDPAPRRWPWRRTAAPGRERPNPTAGPAAVEQERLIVEALADLRDLDVREVMTPRVDVVALTIPVHADDVARAVRETGHSCFPVVHDDLDDLVGVLFVNDLFRTGWRPTVDHTPEPGPLDISRRLRQPFMIPESIGVLEALAEMRRHHRAVAVVVDEYGGVAGILTVKDLLEPLVGELHDEFDENVEPEIVRVDASRWLVDGRASVDDVRDRLGIPVPDGEYVTLGGFLFDGFGHIPEEGETLTTGEWELRVVEMDRRRVAKVVARRRAGPARAGEVAANHPSVTGEPGTGEGPTGAAGGTAAVAAPSGRPGHLD